MRCNLDQFGFSGFLIPLVSGNNSSAGWCMYPYRWFYPRIGSFQNREGVIPLSPSNSTLIWEVDEVSFWMHEDGFKISAFQSWPPKPSLSWTLNILPREAWGLIPEVVSRAWQRRVVLALAMLWCAWISFMPRLCSGVAWPFSLALILDVYSFDTDLIIASLVILQGERELLYDILNFDTVAHELPLNLRWAGCGFWMMGHGPPFWKKAVAGMDQNFGSELVTGKLELQNWYRNRKPLLSLSQCQRFFSLRNSHFERELMACPRQLAIGHPRHYVGVAGMAIRTRFEHPPDSMIIRYKTY